MKSTNIILSLTLASGLIIVPCLAFAATVGSPVSPDSPKAPGLFSLKQNRNIAVKAGMDLDLIFGRDLEVDGADTIKAKINSAQWCMGVVSCTLFDRFSPYIKLGSAHMKVRWTEAGQEVKAESTTDFAWGVGGKLLIWDFKQPKLKLITDGMYRMAELDMSKATVSGSSFILSKPQSPCVLKEWQVALLAASDINVSTQRGEEVLGVSALLPYIGVKYSDVRGRMRIQDSSGSSFFNPGKIEADKKFGVVFGCDFEGPNSVSLSLEGRLIDEEAFTAGITAMF